MKINRMQLGSLIVACTAFAAAPAYAFSSSAPGGGSFVYDADSHTTLRVNDNKCDGHGAYGYWNNTNNRLDNWSGCGTEASRTGLSISAVRACVNVAAAPDPCGNWG